MFRGTIECFETAPVVRMKACRFDSYTTCLDIVGVDTLFELFQCAAVLFEL